MRFLRCPSSSPEDFVIVLGEQHNRTSPKRSPTPRWLVIPEGVLCAGVPTVGATGSGNASACLHPCLEQLLTYPAHDAARKMGGLFLEVKGDFSREVREILERHGHGDD